MKFERTRPMAFVQGDTVIVSGGAGISGKIIHSIEILDLERRSWTLIQEQSLVGAIPCSLS
jgi:hypothetical protein